MGERERKFSGSEKRHFPRCSSLMELYSHGDPRVPSPGRFRGVETIMGVPAPIPIRGWPSEMRARIAVGCGEWCRIKRVNDPAPSGVAVDIHHHFTRTLKSSQTGFYGARTKGALETGLMLRNNCPVGARAVRPWKLGKCEGGGGESKRGQNYRPLLRTTHNPFIFIFYMLLVLLNLFFFLLFSSQPLREREIANPCCPPSDPLAWPLIIGCVVCA